MLDVEFAENFFEEHEELFTHFLKMYMGKNVLYFNMYPNEAYLLVQEKKVSYWKPVGRAGRKTIDGFT